MLKFLWITESQVPSASGIAQSVWDHVIIPPDLEGTGASNFFDRKTEESPMNKTRSIEAQIMERAAGRSGKISIA